MKRSHSYLWVLFFVVFVAVLMWIVDSSRSGSNALPSLAERDSSSDYQLLHRGCNFDIPWRANVQCATLKTPRVKTETGELQFELPVAVIRASGERRSDPIFYLQGGPGAPADLDREGIRGWISWLEHAEIKRDLVLMDRRGAGRSQPSLDCPEYDQFSREVLRTNASLNTELEQGSAILQRCFQRLSQAGDFAPEQFSTQVSAQDAAALMQRLDYEQWNLIGVSYGSRLAIAIAGLPEVRDAELVRAMVLDSVYPPNQGGVLTWPQVMTESIERFFSWCQNQDGCSSKNESSKGGSSKGGSSKGDSSEDADLDGELTAALAQLAKEPLAVPISMWQEQRSARIIINDHRLLSAVFAALYQRHRWNEIPGALKAAREGNAEGLTELIEPFINLALDEDFSSLAFMAVDCQDHVLGTEADYESQLEAFPRFHPYLAPLWESQSCQWLGSAAEPLTLPEHLDVPVLLLAGELDPITPLSWAEELAQQWPHSQLYVVEGSSHSVLGSEPCVHASLPTFLEDPEASWQPDCENN